MPPRAILLAVLLTVALPAAASARLTPLRPSGSGPETVPGEVIVQFKSSTSASARGSARRAADVDALRASRQPGQQLAKVQPGQSVAAAVRALEADPRVAYAQPNYVYHAQAVPNDADFGQLWGLRNLGQAVHGIPGISGTAGSDIDATLAWDRTKGSSSIVVAVADTGITYDHPDLDGNIWSNPGETAGNGTDDDGNTFVDDTRGWDFIDNDNDPRDLNEHGTHVAGTIGAEGNNGIGVAGVNWDVSLMPVRVLNAAGNGSSFGIGQGFDYAGDNGARIVNASLGGGGSSDPAMQGAIDAHPNTLYVVAAGNDGVDNDGGMPHVPCNLASANLVCVAATTETDQLADFSNFGSTSVDLGAPGTDILSTIPHLVFSEDFESGLTGWTNGTGTAWTRSSATSGGGSFSAQDSAGNYAPGENAILQTTTAVPGSGGCPLNWQMRMQTPDAKARLSVETSTNGTTFTSLGSISGDFGPDFFGITAGNLPAGDRFIRFHFTADGDAAPGDGIYIDDVRVGCVDATPAFDGSEYAFLQGTSMATPHVAGAAALALALKPSATVAQLKSALLSSGDSIAALNGTTVTGKRLNVAKLLDTISPPPPAPPGGGGGGGGTPPAGGGGGGTQPPPPPIATIADAKLSGCKVTKSLRVQCSLGSGDAVKSATMTLKKGRKTVARATVKPRNGKLSLKLKKKLKKGSYKLTVTLKDAAGGTRKITKTIKRR